MSTSLSQSILSLNSVTSALKSATGGTGDNSVSQVTGNLSQITDIITKLQTEGKAFVASTTAAISNIKPEDLSDASTYSDLLKTAVADFSNSVESAIQTIAPLKDSVLASGNTIQSTVTTLTSELATLQSTLAGNQAALTKAQKSYSLLSGLGSLGGVVGLSGALALVKSLESIVSGNQLKLQDLQTTLTGKTNLLSLLTSANGSVADSFNVLPGLSGTLEFLQTDVASLASDLSDASSAAAIPVIISAITGALSEINTSVN